jgi:hypothetical protein
MLLYQISHTYLECPLPAATTVADSLKTLSSGWALAHHQRSGLASVGACFQGAELKCISLGSGLSTLQLLKAN